MSLVRAGQNIGRAYLFQNKWDSCYFYYTYALELAREKQYPSEVSILHELGILYRSMGELKSQNAIFLQLMKKKRMKKGNTWSVCLSAICIYRWAM